MDEIIIYVILGAVLIVLYLSNKKKDKLKQKTENKEADTIQSFTNVKDIKDTTLITLNNQYISFIELQPVDIELLNDNDKKRLINNIKAQLVNVNYEFDIFSLPRPFNIDVLKNQYEEDLQNVKNDNQRKLLKNGLKILLDFTEKGNIVERKFYIKIVKSGSIKECEDTAEDMKKRMQNAGIKCKILNSEKEKKEIIKLINLFYNDNQYNYDNYEDTNGIPQLEDI